MIREGGSPRIVVTSHVRCGVPLRFRSSMSRRICTITSALTVVAVALVGCSPAGSEPSPTSVAEPAHWSYDGDSGPASWSEVDADFEACAAGTNQSPIDLPATVPAATTSIELSAEQA